MNPVAVRFPFTVWFPVKVLFTANSGTFAVFRFSVTLPLLPPPLRSVPAVTPVIVPVPALLHFQAPPLHCSVRLLGQLVSKLKFNVPLVPPPVSPLADAVSTPVIVPSPPAKATSNSAGWLVVVFSLLSNVALNVLLATSARPLFVSLPLSHACTAEVTLMRMYWFLSAVVTLTFEAIAAPRGGALLASIVLSNQALLT